MEDITKSYSPNNIFWDMFPQFTIINPFKDLYSKDKSKGKKTSSTLMWAIALLYHPKSDIYNLNDKFERIAKDMLKKKPDYDWSKHKELIDTFIDMALSQAEKSMHFWSESLKDRDDFLSKQEYHFSYSVTDPEGNMFDYKSNVKELDEMRGRTAKLYQDYFKIKKELSEEEVARGRGQKIVSLTDEGLI